MVHNVRSGRCLWKVLGAKQKSQVRTYFCLERAGNRGEKVKKMPHPRGEPEDGHGTMKEDEGRKQMMIMMMMMMRLVMMMMMMTMTTETMMMQLRSTL